MHAGALRALEFDRVVEAVRSFALTPLGAARLGDLRPSTDPRRVEASLAATSEGVAFLAEAEIVLHAPADLDAIVSALAIEGRVLEPMQLRGLAEFLASIDAATGLVRRTAGTHRYPLLRVMAESAASFEPEVSDVRRKIDQAGEVVDEATPELRSIRDRLRKQRSRLRSMLESYLRGKETARYLQDQIVTDRHGRYVLVVKAEHRGAIPGIVHGSSTSGASLFLEPLSTVEINNDIVALEEQEAAEVHRILLALANSFRARPLELKRTLDAATELDVVQAKARFSVLVRGVAPVVADSGRFELKNARHPLLIRAVAEKLSGVAAGPDRLPERDRDSSPVPVDILLAAPTSVLVVTGPNTGGKTVALKTTGLAALMAQSGLHIPADEGSHVIVFRSVFADIGDEQSITANLSTFSWHVTNIASMDRALMLPALVLLDEIGAGTDPLEGGALGVAIIEHFRRRGALVLATTHYDAIKTYASTTEGVVCAAFGFDSATFAPTYQLNYGSPGRSLALEIAQRLGLSQSIIEAARRLRSDREAQLAEHLAKVERQLEAIDHDRRLAARQQEQLLEQQVQLRAREESLRQREDVFRRRLEEVLDERRREARREIDKIVRDLRQHTSAIAAEAARRATILQPGVSTGEFGAARAEAQTAVDTALDHIRRASVDGEGAAPGAARSQAAEAGVAPGAGDRVVVSSLGLEGIVQHIHEQEAEVDVRGKRLRVPTGDLRRIGGPVTAARVQVSVQLQPRDETPVDLNVIGCTVDEALARTEKFIDEALIAEQRKVRLIHGYGTGQLRRALAEFLHGHPLVQHFEAAPPEQGGGGVTVVELKE